jgi:clumping factor A
VVCEDTAHTCVDGCRGVGGNGCPDGEVCTSTDETIGECVPDSEGAGGAGGAGGGNPDGGGNGNGGGSGGSSAQNGEFYAQGGCLCATGQPAKTGGLWLTAVGLIAALARRRRQRD